MSKQEVDRVMQRINSKLVGLVVIKEALVMVDEIRKFLDQVNKVAASSK
jgi:hypothetical protein